VHHWHQIHAVGDQADHEIRDLALPIFLAAFSKNILMERREKARIRGKREKRKQAHIFKCVSTTTVTLDVISD